MKLKTILVVMGMLLPIHSLKGQEIKPLFIDSHIPDLKINSIINYTDSTTKLSDLNIEGQKLLIIDFWNTHCSVCIEQFEKEDSLQKEFNKNLQFILVTSEDKETVETFLQKWESKHGYRFSMPIVVSDTLLSRFIPVYYEPVYAIFNPSLKLIAKTSYELITKENLKNLISYFEKKKARKRIQLKPNTNPL